MDRKYWVFFFLFFLATIGFGQPGGGGDPGPGQPVPISGLEFLLIAGAGLGIRKWLTRSKEK